MSVTLRHADVWAERRRRVAELRPRHPFASQVLDFYGALVGVQEDTYKKVEAFPPAADRVAAYVAEVVLPSIVQVGIAAGPERLRAELVGRFGAEDAQDVVRRWMDTREQHPVDRFLARASLGPVLEALGPEAKRLCNGPRDPRHCPDCGGPPQLSFFAAATEDLATGRRYLRCARCDTAWGYARMACAGCGEDSSARLNIFSELGTMSGERGSVVRGLPGGEQAHPQAALFPQVRIEACDSCRQYLLSIDLAADPSAVPLVDELASIPLDLHARDRGYTKIISNVMGF